MGIHIVAGNYVEHMVTVDSNCNPFENNNVDYYRMKNEFTVFREVF